MRCDECGNEFTPKAPHQVWCCDQCRDRVNTRAKYHRDKRDNPERAARHAQRRRIAREKWAKEQAAAGRCIKCKDGVPEPGRRVCPECLERKRTGVDRTAMI